VVEKKIHIQGMTCHHCVMAVKKELSKIPGLQLKDVAIGSALLEFDEKKVTASQIAAAVEEAGYRVVE
jgi:copper chaperone